MGCQMTWCSAASTTWNFRQWVSHLSPNRFLFLAAHFHWKHITVTESAYRDWVKPVTFMSYFKTCTNPQMLVTAYLMCNPLQGTSGIILTETKYSLQLKNYSHKKLLCLQKKFNKYSNLLHLWSDGHQLHHYARTAMCLKCSYWGRFMYPLQPWESNKHYILWVCVSILVLLIRHTNLIFSVQQCSVICGLSGSTIFFTLA